MNLLPKNANNHSTNISHGIKLLYSVNITAKNEDSMLFPKDHSKGVFTAYKKWIFLQFLMFFNG
jgi:hypothetical protein